MDDITKNTTSSPNQFEKNFQSKTNELLTKRDQDLLQPGEKIKQFQSEVADLEHPEVSDPKNPKYEPTTIKKRSPIDYLQGFVKKVLPKPAKPTSPLLNQNTDSSQTDKAVEEFDDMNKKNFDGMTIQDVIAPLELEVDFNHVQIGDMFYRTLFVSGYPRFVGPNWLSPIINFEHSLRISTFYYPVDNKIILEKLKRKIGEIEATLYGQMEGRKAVDPSLKVALSDAQQLQDSIAEGTEKYFHFGMYITISAKDLKTLDKISRNAISTLAAISVSAKSALLQQEQGVVTTQPVGLDKIYVTRNMDTTSLATTFPFVTSELTMDHGIMYGINQHNRSLVIFDRFDLENANTVVFAKAGAGKSYFVKLEAVRSLMLGTQLIIIDPEREYKDLCDAVGGSYISFSQDKGNKMNPFELSGLGDPEDDELRIKLLSLQGFFRILFEGLNNIEMSILDRALLLTYREKGITLDPATQRGTQPPMLEDLYKVLKGMSEEDAHNMARRLERFIIGSGAGIFNEASTVTIKNPFTVFSIRDLQEELRPMAMYLMLDYIWTVIRKDQRRRIMVVDEAWYMMQNPDSAKFMYSIAKRARKYYLGLTTITQDVDDFLKNDMGRAIISNSSIQVLMKQSPSSVERLQQVFNLSEGEKSFLLNCEQGQGLFFAGANHVGIQVVSSVIENELITTNPKELEKKRQNAGQPDTRTAEELSQMYLPPAMQDPIKSGVTTDEKLVIRSAIETKKKDIDMIMEERQSYLDKLKEDNSVEADITKSSLSRQIMQKRQDMQKNSTHITPQGIIQSILPNNNGQQSDEDTTTNNKQ